MTTFETTTTALQLPTQDLPHDEAHLAGRRGVRGSPGRWSVPFGVRAGSGPACCPILRRRDGQRLDRRTAHRWVRSIGKRAGVGAAILTCFVPAPSWPLPSKRACRCGTCRSLRVMLILEPRPSTTGDARTSTATPPTSWWLSSRKAEHPRGALDRPYCLTCSRLSTWPSRQRHPRWNGPVMTPPSCSDPSAAITWAASTGGSSRWPTPPLRLSLSSVLTMSPVLSCSGSRSIRAWTRAASPSESPLRASSRPVRRRGAPSPRGTGRGRRGSAPPLRSLPSRRRTPPRSVGAGRPVRVPPDHQEARPTAHRQRVRCRRARSRNPYW
jgi:hypothetical protein